MVRESRKLALQVRSRRDALRGCIGSVTVEAEGERTRRESKNQGKVARKWAIRDTKGRRSIFVLQPKTHPPRAAAGSRYAGGKEGGGGRLMHGQLRGEKYHRQMEKTAGLRQRVLSEKAYKFKMGAR